MAGSVAAFAVPAALGGVFGIEPEMQQRITVDGGDHGHIAAAPTISAARSPAGDVFFAPERQAAVATIAGLHGNSRFVYEHQEKAAGPTCRPAAKLL
jgi:hypothetical protein